MIMSFLLTILIVGFVTAGLNIRFDLFFTILLLLFIFGFNIIESVNLFLWIIMLGSLMILLNNQNKIRAMPRKMKVKLFAIVPTLTFIASLMGSWAFSVVDQSILIATLGMLALFYGLRLVAIHFEEHELEFEKGHPTITKICGTVGPVVSGFFIGLVGTSLKPLKIPFAIKIGKMNAKQVYLGNSVSAFFASSFAIVWHFFLTKGMTMTIFYNQMVLGLALFAGTHFVFELTNLFFRKQWRKPFQILIGAILMLVSLKVFMLVF